MSEIENLAKLEKALYQCDLMQDEFIRISLLTENEEIKALCERAQIRLESEVPFFGLIKKLESKARRYDALVSEIELNARADGWISVDKWLPDADFEVLVCCDDDVFVDVMRSGCVDGDFWFDCERDCGRNVTHWMPLPEPPK